MKAIDRNKIVKAVTALLYARRSLNVRREQAAYGKVRDLCAEFNLDMEHTVSQVVEHLKKTSVAASMNGVV